MNADNCVPKSANEEPKLKNDPIPAIKSAAVNAIIAPDKYPVAVKTLLSTILIPVINGIRFVMNIDKLAPITGKADDAAEPMPPIIPPTNCPIAVPIDCNRFPPSFMSCCKPGICDNAPIAANTIANSAITNPTPITPAIALGIRATTPESAYINPVIKVTAKMVLNRFSPSIPFKAEIIPSKNEPIKFTAAVIKAGMCSAKLLMRPINNVKRELTICGV